MTLRCAGYCLTGISTAVPRAALICGWIGKEYVPFRSREGLHKARTVCLRGFLYCRDIQSRPSIQARTCYVSAHANKSYYHFLQQWFGLSDAAMEETLYDPPLYRVFSGTDVFEDQRSAAREGVDAAFGHGRRFRADPVIAQMGRR